MKRRCPGVLGLSCLTLIPDDGRLYCHYCLKTLRPVMRRAA